MFTNTYEKYDYLKFPSCFNTGNLSDKCKRHMVQDVMTPFAILFMAVGIEAVRQGYSDDDDLSPLLTQCLELCYSKSPKDVRPKKNLSRAENWIPPDTESRFFLNSRGTCQSIRLARGDVIEPFDKTQISMQTRQKFAEQYWNQHKLPSNTFTKSRNLFMLEAVNCQNCGSGSHTRSQCEWQFELCEYPHLGNLENPRHSTLMCPDLMSFCNICKIRGHRDQEHQEGPVPYTPLQLRKKFKEFAHLGKYSCLPFIWNTGKLKNHHFKLGMSAMLMPRAQPDLWLYCGKSARIPDQIFKTTEWDLEMQRIVGNRDKNEWEYILDKSQLK